MSAIAIDTLKFSNRLKAAGFTPEQAEAQAEAFAEAVGVSREDLTTKADLHELRAELKGELTLIKWMLGVTVTGVVAVLVRLLFMHG